MNQYEFVIVLLSIIVGLGLTELLTSIARQIKNRATIRHYWPQSGIVAAIFIALLQQWWESWGLRSQLDWSFIHLLLMLAGPVALFIIAHLLFPTRMENADIKAHYFDNARILWLVALVGTVIATSFRPLAFGSELIHPDNATSLFLSIGFVVLIVVRNERFHSLAMPFLLIALLADIFIFNYEI